MSYRFLDGLSLADLAFEVTGATADELFADAWEAGLRVIQALELYEPITLAEMDRMVAETPGAIRREGSLRVAESADELERNARLELLIHTHLEEISMREAMRERIEFDIVDERVHRLAAFERERKDARFASLGIQLRERDRIDPKHLRLDAMAVENSRDAAFLAGLRERLAAHLFTERCLEREFF